MIDIKNAMQTAMSLRGVTRAQIEQQVGMSRQSFDSAMRAPNLKTLERLALALNLPVWMLISFGEAMPVDTRPPVMLEGDE
jgi:transcriptional regulator with XRE-family HTH domain